VKTQRAYLASEQKKEKSFRSERNPSKGSIAELDLLADDGGVTVLLDELNELHDAVGNELVADALILGECGAELVKEVDDLLLGLGRLDVLLDGVDDNLANLALDGVGLDLSRAELDLLADLLGGHGLDVLDDVLELAVKDGRADLGIRRTSVGADGLDELLDLLVGLALIEVLVNNSDDGLTGGTLGVGESLGAKEGGDDCNKGKLHLGKWKNGKKN